MEVVIGTAVVFLAGFIQGLTSFGFALVSIPFLSRVLPLKEAVPVIVILGLFTNLLIISNCYREIKIKKIWILVLFSIIFAPIGVYTLKYINSNYLKIFAGTGIMIFSVLLILKKSFPVKNEKAGFIIAGAASGFLNGSLSLSGPPVALFLSNQGINKEGFRANITFYSIILNIITIGTYFANDLLNKTIIKNMVYFIPATIIGVFIGIICSKKTDEKLFKKITLILLIVSGAWTIINTVKDMMT